MGGGRGAGEVHIPNQFQYVFRCMMKLTVGKDEIERQSV